MEPIVPFEPIKTDRIVKGERWIAQVKWDGVRILTYFDGRNVRLFNRKKNERTAHYPEITDIHKYFRADSVILDGEMIALGPDGTPSFHQVMRRDGIRRLDRVDQARKIVSVTYMVFDVVFFNGKWLDNRPLKERMEILSDKIRPNEHVQPVAHFDDGEALFDAVCEKGMEGIVLKDLESSYLIGGKDDRWQKKKNYRDLIAVIGGVTYRGSTVNAVLLGLYDDRGKLWYIGHAGTGRLTADDWRRLTERVQPLITHERPFVNRTERMREVTWVRPRLAVKIQYIEWLEGRSVRQPSIQAFVDVPPEECTLP